MWSSRENDELASQPAESLLSGPSQNSLNRIQWGILSFSLLCIMFTACCLLPSVIYDALFSRSVDLKRMDWRFEATYEVCFGVSLKHSRLSCQGSIIHPPSQQAINLVTPIGEFVSSPYQPGWNAHWSDPPVYDDDFRLPDLPSEGSWVRQIEHARDVDSFLQRGWYQAPKESMSYDIPWTGQQLKGTPTDWVYVYRLSWSDREYERYEGHSVNGYWVAPERLADLSWE